MDQFLELDAAAELLAIEAAVAPAQAREWIRELIRADAVRLRDPAGHVLRFSATREVAAARAARAAAPTQGRYNPLAYAARRREGGAPAPRMRPSSDQLWAAGYAAHLVDLERALARQLGVSVALCQAMAAATSPAPALPNSAGPIDQLVDFFRRRGREPGFEKAPQDLWRQAAARDGLMFERADFAAAWRMAVQANHVVPLEGAPAREKQSKRVAAPPPAQKATGT